MKHCICLLLFLVSLNNFGQTKFRVKEVTTKNWKSIYHLVNEKGETIKELDSAKYIVSMNDDNYRYFAVFMIKGENGWCAINSDEKMLFKIYNTSFGEPSPDELTENRIRIIDENNKIGFADYKGNIVIKPRFEMATSFHKGKAIVGESCEKIPWDSHAKENDCHHYSIVCKRHGYINAKGEIVEIGNYGFEAVQQKIQWKAPE